MALTVEQATKLAQIIWRRAPSLPNRAKRVRALQRATNLVALARGRERARTPHAPSETRGTSSYTG